MAKPTPRELASRILPARSRTTADLRSHGVGKLAVRRLVTSGGLVRVRTGRYVAGNTDARLIAAARLGGRLSCVSLLSALDVFVRLEQGLHLQVDRGASRLPARDRTVVTHWREHGGESGRDALSTCVVDALVLAVPCQSPRDAVATLDSAWHHGLVDERDIAEIFRRLPQRFAPLRPLLDPRSEAGTETLMRLLLRALGHHVEVQVTIRGVGRVDLLVDGWLIVECDSREFHAEWSARQKDLRRDLAAARLGYTSVRPTAADIMLDHDEMVATMRDILSHPRPAPRQAVRVPNSSKTRRIRAGSRRPAGSSGGAEEFGRTAPRGS